MLALISLAGLFFVWIGVTIHFHRKRARTRARTLASIANYFGAKRDGDSITWTVGGVGVHLAYQTPSHGPFVEQMDTSSTNRERPRTILFVRWPNPMDLGLTMRCQGGLGSTRFPQLDAWTSGADRSRIWLFANEPARAHALLHPAMIEALRSLGQFDMSDHGLGVELLGHMTDLAYLVWTIERMLLVARMVHEARGGVPIASPHGPLAPCSA